MSLPTPSLLWRDTPDSDRCRQPGWQTPNLGLPVGGCGRKLTLPNTCFELCSKVPRLRLFERLGMPARNSVDDLNDGYPTPIGYQGGYGIVVTCIGGRED